MMTKRETDEFLAKWRAARRQFKPGSGCFICRCCGKQTRDTGNDEGSVGLCLACYESAGEDNNHADNHAEGAWDPERGPEPDWLREDRAACPICRGEREWGECLHGRSRLPKS